MRSMDEPMGATTMHFTWPHRKAAVSLPQNPRHDPECERSHQVRVDSIDASRAQPSGCCDFVDEPSGD